LGDLRRGEKNSLRIKVEKGRGSPSTGGEKTEAEMPSPKGRGKTWESVGGRRITTRLLTIKKIFWFGKKGSRRANLQTDILGGGSKRD